MSVEVVFWSVVIVRGHQLRTRAMGRTAGSWESAAVSFAVVFGTNIVLVAVADLLLARGEGRLQLDDTLFFVFLFSILTMLYDRYRPINDYRVAAGKAEAAQPRRETP